MRLAHRTIVALGALVALGLSGCPWWLQNGRPDSGLIDVDSAGAVTAAMPDLRAALATGAWSRTPRSVQPEVPPETRRWQCQKVEELVTQPQPPRRALRSLLSDRNAAVAANAAIALALLGDSAGADCLAATARTVTLKLPTRCAAIEALGALDHPPRADLLRELLEQYGRFDPQSQAHYVAELHAELIHALARHAEPSDQPQLLAALRSPAAEVRLKSLQALGRLVRGDLPDELSDLRTDPDARVRAASMTVLAQHRGAHVEEYLAGGLNDCELRVRLAAIRALGILPTGSARATLRTLLDDSSELIRTAAVAALASAGDKRAVLEAAGDKSWRVRVAVAEALAAYPDADGAALVQELLQDRSISVQEQVIQSLGAWPLEQAGPILLETMATGVYSSRKAAARLLAQRWPPAGRFASDAPPERRREILSQLEQTFREQVGLAEPQPVAPPDGGRPVVSEATLSRAGLLVQRLSDPTITEAAGGEAVAELKALGANGADILEELALDRGRLLPAVVYHDVLPVCEPAFAQLDRMRSEEVSERRRAASELAEIAAKHPLRPLAMARLAELAATETDQLVWQSVLAAVAGDGSEPAVRLAAVAIGHPSPEIRRRACEFLSAHPDPRHAPILVPALDDGSEQVVIAATRALGLSGRQEDAPPLRKKLGARSELVQLEAAVALARLGDPSGVFAMERLSHSASENVRRGDAVAMGEVPSPSFVPILIRMLDDRQSVRLAAMASLPKAAGQDVGGMPGEPTARMAERVDRWKRWFHER